MEVINSGMIQKIMVDKNSLPDIFSNIDENISVHIQDLVFSGTLKKVSSKIIDEEIFKELTILIEKITIKTNGGIDSYLSLPELKHEFIGNIIIK